MSSITELNTAHFLEGSTENWSSPAARKTPLRLKSLVRGQFELHNNSSPEITNHINYKKIIEIKNYVWKQKEGKKIRLSCSAHQTLE